MNNRQMLQASLKRIQKNQIFLASILSAPITTSMRDAINTHLKECVIMETAAANIAASRCWNINDLPPGSKMIATCITKFRLFRLKNDSMIASALILHYTKNIIEVLTYLHRLYIPDPRIINLSQSYLDFLTAVIHQLQGFL